MNDKEYLEGKKVKYAIFQTPSLLFFFMLAGIRENIDNTVSSDDLKM